MPSAVASASPAPAAASSTSGGGQPTGNQPSWPTHGERPSRPGPRTSARTAHSKRQPRPISSGQDGGDQEAPSPSGAAPTGPVSKRSSVADARGRRRRSSRSPANASQRAPGPTRSSVHGRCSTTATTVAAGADGEHPAGAAGPPGHERPERPGRPRRRGRAPRRTAGTTRPAARTRPRTTIWRGSDRVAGVADGLGRVVGEVAAPERREPAGPGQLQHDPRRGGVGDERRPSGPRASALYGTGMAA